LLILVVKIVLQHIPPVSRHQRVAAALPDRAGAALWAIV